MGAVHPDPDSRDVPSRGGHRWVLVAALFVAFALIAWIGALTSAYRRPAEVPQAEPVKRRPVRLDHVIIVLIDTLRADRLGVYGYDKDTSPHIDALAKEGVVFTSCDAPAPWTLPSVVSIMTSTFPCEHGVVVDGQQIGSSPAPFAERLKDCGYATASLYANPYAGPMSGLNRGFDHVAYHRAVDGDKVASWLETIPAGPFFAYIHNVEPHDAFDAPMRLVKLFGDAKPADKRMLRTLLLAYRRLTRVDFAEGRPLGTTDNTDEQRRAINRVAQSESQMQVLYDAAVRYADERVGSIIDTLKRRGVWDNTLFIVTSDHGEELYDHGGWQHDQSVYEELVHVPLIMRFPDASIAPRRIDEVISLVDLMPTVLDYLGRHESSSDCRGRSLMPLIDDPQAASAAAMTVTSMRINRKKYYKPYKESRGDVNVVVRDGAWKGIYNVELGSFELYKLDDDPAEQVNLAADEADVVERMRGVAQQWLDECLAAGATNAEGAPNDMEDTWRDRLRSLGYVE